MVGRIWRIKMVGSSFFYLHKILWPSPKERSASSRLVKPPMSGPNFGVIGWWLQIWGSKSILMEKEGGGGHIKIIIWVVCKFDNNHMLVTSNNRTHFSIHQGANSPIISMENKLYIYIYMLFVWARVSTGTHIGTFTPSRRRSFSGHTLPFEWCLAQNNSEKL